MSRIALLLPLLLAPAMLFAQSPREIILELQRRAEADSQRYEGTLKVINARGNITDKRWQYDRIGSHGRSKAVLRFTDPPEVKGVALLIVNHPDRASDQWMWTPAIARERRIAIQDRSTRFFGTDFSFEDLEERDVDQYDYRLLGEETAGGASCWRIESRAKKTRSSQYTSVILWVRQDLHVFARIDSFKKDKLIRRLEYRDFEKVSGIWTARELEIADLRRGSRTILRLEKLEYNVPMKNSDFTIQAMRRGL